jgi:two-component system sensor histidine kinase CpxA
VKHTLSFKTTTPDGEDYLLVSTFKHPTLVRYLLAPQRVVLSIFISGLICFFLARYFTSPLAKLRSSTQMLTNGEFDTTALRHLRNRSDEFGALAVDFEHMTVRLSELLNSKRQLLRDISHELRSPLARIRVALGLARIKYQFADTDELDRIEREIARLESLINELLTFARIRASAKPPSTTRVNIHELLDMIVTDAQYERQQARGKNSIKLHCSRSINVKGDAQLLHRAIENIVRNACYYSPENTVIHIRCTLTTENVRIAIEDFGPGVPNDMLEKIFQPFVRVSPARETGTGGNGIGLAIAKQVIEIHNGAITAINKTDSSGLIVTITLPVHRESSERSAA